MADKRSDLAFAAFFGGGKGSGGGSVTVDAALDANSTNPVQNKAIASALEAKQNKPTVVTVSGATPTITAADNTIYECGTLTSLTVSSFPATGEFSVTFTSGAAATTLSVPQTMIMPDGFSVDANTRYEINVKNGYAVVAGWTVSAS